MIRHYCDICEALITEANKTGVEMHYRLGVKLHHNGHQIDFEILHVLDGISNAGDFCKYCILDAFYRLDDRPKGKSC